MVTVVTIYNMFVVPFILVFPEYYQPELTNGETASQRTTSQKNLKTIEVILDVVYLFEIILNFFKKTRAHTTITQIAKSYIKFYFIFDVLSIIPLFEGESFELYYLKCLRFVHLYRLYVPLELLLGVVLANYSKKRQSDLIRFLNLILLVIYVAHFMACIWI